MAARYVLSFESTHAAIDAEKRLRHLNPQVIPTPTSISAGCGISLLFRDIDLAKLEGAIEAASLAQVGAVQVISKT
jgi:hypothetical protein